MTPFQAEQFGKTEGLRHFGAARRAVWAASPSVYLSAPPAHPVELRARRGRCRPALFGEKRKRARGPSFRRRFGLMPKRIPSDLATYMENLS